MGEKKNVEGASIWHCPANGVIHSVEDHTRPHKDCRCFNCEMARINARIDKERANDC